ncbi:hypothetical protein SK128_011937, partial [Halocaridina rubra]
GCPAPGSTCISLLQEGAAAAAVAAAASATAQQRRQVTNFKEWISGALGTLQMAQLSPPAAVKLGHYLGVTTSFPSALSGAWVGEGMPLSTAATTTTTATPPTSQPSVSVCIRPSSTPAGPSTSSPSHVMGTGCSWSLVGGGGDKGRQHKCSKCGDVFPLPAMLAMHSLNHVEKRPF